MRTEELILKGTPAQFLNLVDTFDDMRTFRLPPGTPKGSVFSAHTPAHGPWAGQASDVVKASVNIYPPGWQGKPKASIEATSLPDNKTRLVLWSEETDWPEVEPLWNELKDELQRLEVLFGEDKIEIETTTITGYKIQEQHLALNCDVATFVGAVEAYAARLANFSIHNLPFYEVTRRGEKSADIIIWPNQGAERLIDRGRKLTWDNAGKATVQAGPAGGCLVILTYTNQTWPTIENRWAMLVTMLEQLGYIGAPIETEPQTEPQPERPKVPRGRKPELNQDEARIACRLYEELQKQKKKVTQQDIADALGLGLGTFQAYWQAYKDGEL